MQAVRGFIEVRWHNEDAPIIDEGNRIPTQPCCPYLAKNRHPILAPMQVAMTPDAARSGQHRHRGGLSPHMRFERRQSVVSSAKVTAVLVADGVAKSRVLRANVMSGCRSWDDKVRSAAWGKTGILTASGVELLDLLRDQTVR